MQPNDSTYLRKAFALAQKSRDSGNHPFGALLVAGDGTILLEAENQSRTQADATGHAERVLLTQASQRFDAATLAQATMYTSAEPCAMCAGAVWTQYERTR